ncbi:gluconate 2-dehydrogenase subunit 3 family protein [Cellulophaga sp. HaHaR_3_176]|uniref:gluconate 2-dehydrogenase subunit 3 family protein n=1 Tax=Cellulophaga sp. HaHaR_3_176 TaxID=1942464 RepID=UPI001C200131|nr:gluconate 2-dehydrogenase subunit 3 family protein [Cellulophaga sp. HaHaR_3_176]QWX84769.1 gluconate 2-dehydrogenase subunit 3 family protein [Cellulophaga sp. HaHaR_3_176]
MDRRKSIKSIILGGVAGGLALNGCKPENVEPTGENIALAAEKHFGRTPEEKELIAKLNADQFLNSHEMSTLNVLVAIILPANESYGSALDAEVPDFIEFMTKDYPKFQMPIRGGLMWLDHKSNTDFGVEFIASTAEQQKVILDTIAYPNIEIPENERPLEVQFFSLIRNLTLTGYYTSKMGIEDLGYVGNSPNVWDGVPDDVLKQHGVAYEEEWLAKCVDQSKRNTKAEWDEKGNLLT